MALGNDLNLLVSNINHLPSHALVTACAFCEIVAGRAPATIHATMTNLGRKVLIIEPLNPVVPGHLLAIPAVHVQDAREDREVTGYTFAAAAYFTREPCNLITSCGREATQTVMHLHVHIVPRRDGDNIALPWSNSLNIREEGPDVTRC